MGTAHIVLDHREAPVTFTCSGARLSGTLFLPLTPGPHPAVVWLHGSGEQARLSYGPLVASFVRDGIAFFSYDKRGVGSSEGSCCPDELGHFNLVTADAVGAVDRTPRVPVDRPYASGLRRRQRGRLDRSASSTRIGAGCVRRTRQPRRSAAQHRRAVRAVRRRSGSTSPRPAEDEIATTLASWKPSGFDPTPDLEKLDVPALWLFGGGDRNVPPVQSVALLRSIKQERGKDWTIVVFAGAGHGLFDAIPTDLRAGPTAEAWVRHHVDITP